MSTGPFPKILHIGDAMIADLLDGEVEVTEKVDGSQFGFGKVNGRLFCRSKGAELDLDNPNEMFKLGVEYVKSIEDKIPDNYTFYGEYLKQPKHNTLAYDNIPKNHIALFGVYNYTTKEFYKYETIKKWAGTFGVSCVPRLAKGILTAEDILKLVQEKKSFLGGQNIEGVVVKAYKPWLFLQSIPLNVMSGKYVTEAFKEVHQKNWKAENTGKGKLEMAVAQYKSQARWNKAVQHLRDNGTLTGTPKDIGNLINEVRKDISEEEKENIKNTLWSIYKDQFFHKSCDGLAQWWKEELVKGEINANDKDS